jgi:hypothetical protein
MIKMFNTNASSMELSNENNTQMNDQKNAWLNKLDEGKMNFSTIFLFDNKLIIEYKRDEVGNVGTMDRDKVHIRASYICRTGQHVPVHFLRQESDTLQAFASFEHSLRSHRQQLPHLHARDVPLRQLYSHSSSGQLGLSVRLLYREERVRVRVRRVQLCMQVLHLHTAHQWRHEQLPGLFARRQPVLPRHFQVQAHAHEFA